MSEQVGGTNILTEVQQVGGSLSRTVLFLEPAVGCASERNLKPTVSKKAIYIPCIILLINK